MCLCLLPSLTWMHSIGKVEYDQLTYSFTHSLHTKNASRPQKSIQTPRIRFIWVWDWTA